MKKAALYILIQYVTCNIALAQFYKDGALSNYEDKLIFYSDLGFNSSPYSIKSNFLGSTSKLHYSHNFRLEMGFGFSHKWINLQLNLPLPVYTKALSRFGQNICYGFQFNLNPSKFQLEFDLKYSKGFALKDAFFWNDSLNELNPNIIKPENTLFYLGTKAWYFQNQNFKLKYLNGVTGVYNQHIFSWFANSAFRFNSLKDPNGIIPIELQSDTVSKTKSNVFSCAEITIIPGFAGVLVFNNFQLSLIGGVGGAVQLKQYRISKFNKSFLGLTPRYEIGINAGYSKPNYFIFLTSDIENIQLVWNDLKYNQFYYAFKIRFGYRLNKKNTSSYKNYFTESRLI